MVSITEVIKPIRGVTRYCNCDSSTCDHNDFDRETVCPAPARVVATVDGISLQLCNECLKHAKAS